MDLDRVALDLLLPAIEPILELGLRASIVPGRSIRAARIANSRRDRLTGIPSTVDGELRQDRERCRHAPGRLRPVLPPGGRWRAGGRRARRDRRACRDSRRPRCRDRAIRSDTASRAVSSRTGVRSCPIAQLAQDVEARAVRQHQVEHHGIERGSSRGPRRHRRRSATHRPSLPTSPRPTLRPSREPDRPRRRECACVISSAALILRPGLRLA